MVAIKAEDLQGFVGGQWVRVDGGCEFQGPVQTILDGDNGGVEIICAWAAEYDCTIGRCKPHNDLPVIYTIDLAHGTHWITKDGSEFYHNPHVCPHVKPEDEPCHSPKHLACTSHLYAPGNAMEVRVAGVEVLD